METRYEVMIRVAVHPLLNEDQPLPCRCLHDIAAMDELHAKNRAVAIIQKLYGQEGIYEVVYAAPEEDE